MNEDIHKSRLLEARRLTPAEVAGNLGVLKTTSEQEAAALAAPRQRKNGFQRVH